MKFIKFILKMRWVVISLTLAATILCGFSMAKIKLNSDIASYLADDSMSKKTIKFLQDNFDIQGDAVLAITAEKSDIEKITEIKEKLTHVENISADKLLWQGTFPAFIDTGDKYFKLDDKGRGTFIFYVSIDAQNSSKEAGIVIDKIDDILKESGFSYYIGGNAIQTKVMLDSALGDLPIFLGVAVAIIFIILLFTSKSIIEPFIFLLTIGISIIINLGTNGFMGSISTVTFSAAAILQLALSMDYSIYLSHAYIREKANGATSVDAMAKALKNTFVTVSASALTTVAGFMALLAMKFGLGFDLGIVLAKGVAISMLTVLVFQSSLILVCSNLIDKTSRKKSFKTELKPLQKVLPKAKWGIIVVALLLIIPSIFIQNNVKYYYLNTFYDNEATGAKAVIQDMGGQNVIAVPTSDKNQHKEFLNYLKTLKTDDDKLIVSEVTGFYTFVDPNLTDEQIAQNPMLSIAIPYLKAQFFKNGYTFYQLSLASTPESQDAIKAVKDITTFADNIFDDEIYISGNTQAVIDTSSTTKTDFIVVSSLSALLIFIILVISLKSFIKSILLILVIEGGIMVNLAITALSGSPINFMSYIIISSILLGATVDYAILFTTTMQHHEKTMPRLEAVKASIAQSSFSLIVSAAILVSATLSVYFFASDIIIKEITLLIARGATISFIFVLTLLPSLFLLNNKKFNFNFKNHKKVLLNEGDQIIQQQDTQNIIDDTKNNNQDTQNIIDNAKNNNQDTQNNDIQKNE